MLTSASDLVLEVARKCGFDVLLMSYKKNEHHWRPRVSAGPRSCSFSLRHRMLFVPEKSDAEDMLHELVHLILGKPSLVHSEAYVLLPFESALAEWIGRHLSCREQRAFLRAVKAYQDDTVVFSGLALGELVNPRKKRWWYEGFDRAVKLGVITQDGQPTFSCADWHHSGVVPYVCPEVDNKGNLTWRPRSRK